MNLSEFNFDLPPELIAQKPVSPRDEARLLVYNRLNDTISHHQVKDLPQLLPTSTILVANNSKVRNSRLWASFEQKDIEILVLELTSGTTYRCLIGGKGLKVGSSLTIYTDKTRTQSANLRAVITATEPNPSMTTFLLEFSGADDIEAAFAEFAETPLPPYITERSSQPEQYQTVYARELGSAAAPTAGLHFTPALLQNLQSAGHAWEEVTLHVGLGTFLPLREEKIESNHLHSEKTFITTETADTLNATERPIIPVGTTSTRTLESHMQAGTLQSGFLATDLFVYPGYTFQICNGLMTNFHLPHSSLLLLVSAMLGNHPSEKKLSMSPEEMVQKLHQIYATAIKERYRFYSFGDAMLII